MENKRHLDDSGFGSDEQQDKRICLYVPEYTTETPFVNGKAFSTQEQHSNVDSPAEGQHSGERQLEETSNNGLDGELGTTLSFDDVGQINQYWQDWIQNNPDSRLSPSLMDVQPSAAPTYEIDSGFASGSAMGSCSSHPLSENGDSRAAIESNRSDGG